MRGYLHLSPDWALRRKTKNQLNKIFTDTRYLFTGCLFLPPFELYRVSKKVADLKEGPRWEELR